MVVRIHTVGRSLLKCVKGYQPSCMFAADLSMAAILPTRNKVDASSVQKPTYDDLVQKVSALEEELANVRQKRYVVDPPSYGDRDGRDDLKEAVCSKWSVDVATDRSKMLYSIDNSGLDIVYSVKDRKHVLSFSSWCPLRQVLTYAVKEHIVDTRPRDNPDLKSIWEVISSANLLYRLCCLFSELPVEIDGPNGYKFVWNIFLKHKASGKVFGFLDCKGAATYQTPCGELQDEWVDDWIELLDLLCSDHCPHPYDGCVAGSVA